MRENIKDKIVKFSELLEDAECVWLGSGAGLTSSADPRFNYMDEKSFAENYPAMLQYGFKKKAELMGFGLLPPEILWGYYLTHVNEVRFTPNEEIKYPIYSHLWDIIKTKHEFFVITTNVDALFERYGFPKERIYTPQGDYARMQCLENCSNNTWDTKPIIDKILPNIDPLTQKITDPSLLPKCPNCGSNNVFLNVRGAGMKFIDNPYKEQEKRYKKWIVENSNKRILVIDIGSGFNTPVWVRWPAEKIVMNNKNANLIRINLFQPEVPQEIKDRSISFKSNAFEVISSLWKFLGY